MEELVSVNHKMSTSQKYCTIVKRGGSILSAMLGGVHQSTASVKPPPTLHGQGLHRRLTQLWTCAEGKQGKTSQSWGKQGERPDMLALPEGPQKLPRDGRGDKGEVPHPKLGRVYGRSLDEQAFSALMLLLGGNVGTGGSGNVVARACSASAHHGAWPGRWQWCLHRLFLQWTAGNA